MLSHEVSDRWVSFDFSGGFCGFPPGEAVSLRWGSSSSSFPKVLPMFGQVASFLVADEALVVPYVLHPFTGREVDLVYVHSIGVRMGGSASWRNITVMDMRALLPYCDRAFFNNTWTGDTHEETDVLPSARQDEDSGR